MRFLRGGAQAVWSPDQRHGDGARGVNLRHALVRNTAWYGARHRGRRRLRLVMSVILARGLGPSLMGDLSYVIWAERTLTALAALGYMFATVRYTAETFGRGEGDRAWGVRAGSSCAARS